MKNKITEIFVYGENIIYANGKARTNFVNCQLTKLSITKRSELEKLENSISKEFFMIMDIECDYFEMEAIREAVNENTCDIEDSFYKKHLEFVKDDIFDHCGYVPFSFKEEFNLSFESLEKTPLLVCGFSSDGFMPREPIKFELVIKVVKNV